MVELRSRLKTKMTMDFTPLVDIIFILLIFFILSYNEIQLRGHQLQLPEDNEAEALIIKENRPIIISVYKNGRTLINGKPIDKKNIAREINSLAVKRYDTNKSIPDVIIDAEGQTDLQTMVIILDAVKASGIKKAPFLHTQKKAK